MVAEPDGCALDCATTAPASALAPSAAAANAVSCLRALLLLTALPPSDRSLSRTGAILARAHRRAVYELWPLAKFLLCARARDASDRPRALSALLSPRAGLPAPAAAAAGSGRGRAWGAAPAAAAAAARRRVLRSTGCGRPFPSGRFQVAPPGDRLPVLEQQEVGRQPERSAQPEACCGYERTFGVYGCPRTDPCAPPATPAAPHRSSALGAEDL